MKLAYDAQASRSRDGDCGRTGANRPRSAPSGGGQGRQPPAASDLLAQRLERRPQFGREQRRLFPGSEMAAPRKPVVVDEFWIGLLGPALRRMVDLVSERTYSQRDPY